MHPLMESVHLTVGLSATVPTYKNSTKVDVPVCVPLYKLFLSGCSVTLLKGTVLLCVLY